MPVSPYWAYQADAAQTRDYAPGELFAYGVALHPDKLAINDGKRHYTFAQLEAMATRLAHWLAAQGVSAGGRVPVLSEKHALMPVIAAACWKLGAVYVPLDGQLPENRLRKLLARLSGRVVLALSRAPLADTDTGTWLNGEALMNVCETGPVAPLACVVPQDDDTAYIIFTSGSTGEPKGVEISVGSMKTYFRAHNEVLRFTPDSRVFSLSPFHFDVSIEDTLLPLSLGAYVYQFASLHAGPVMRAAIAREQITHLIAVSTLLTLITEGGKQISSAHFASLQMVMTGAEVCDPKIINLWKQNLPGIRLINAYGPTETTIVCLCYTIEQADPQRLTSWPVGKPLRDVDCLVLGDDGEPALPETPGELCIGGPLVMKGYLGQPQETAKVIFVRDGVRYYRTGDICLMQTDGNVRYIGRRDDEVKIAGRRIHLGEIRQKCLSSAGVERAAVRVMEVRGKAHIAVVLTGKNVARLPHIEEYLRSELPSYMLPAIWGWADDVNLSSTGKTDERTLLDQLFSAANATPCRYFQRPEGDTFIPLNGVGYESAIPL
ncbi:amino acid adenylation domain-containing protein [Cronobacter dublinensis]|uniref:amino acid adenylation domain-containing protein n=1 Tax=Cronobacter dublinensis TaxID=413497 RepID=UPI0003A2BA08|nr:amino acid adenylation domain-containing protein [Cronobacter dublinensis]NCH97668.1 amino acid adenylation domain-containing protein [Cronobacter dublinensis]